MRSGVEAEAPRVEGIADGRVRRKRRPQPREGRGRERGKLDAELVAEVGDQGGLAARERHLDEAPRGVRLRIGRKHHRGLEHLVEIAHADDAELPEEGVIEAVLAGEAPGMRLDERAALLAAAELEGDDAFAVHARLLGGSGERLHFPDGLEIEEDDADPLVTREMAEIVGHGQDRLVAGGDEVGEADLALVLGERDGDRAALGDERQRPLPDLRHVTRGPDRRPVVDVDEPEIVRPGDGDAVSLGHVLDAALERLALGVAIGIAVGIDEDGVDVARRRLVHERRPLRRRDREKGRIGALGKRLERGKASEARDLGVARIHRMNAAPIAHEAQIADDARADRIRPLGRPHDRDRLRVHQLIEGRSPFRVTRLRSRRGSHALADEA